MHGYALSKWIERIVQAHNESGITWPLSNYGTCTDLSAPGISIVSLSGTADGTSMAAPHITDTIAQLLSDGITPSFTTLTENGGTVTANDGNEIPKHGIYCSERERWLLVMLSIFYKFVFSINKLFSVQMIFLYYLVVSGLCGFRACAYVHSYRFMRGTDSTYRDSKGSGGMK